MRRGLHIVSRNGAALRWRDRFIAPVKANDRTKTVCAKDVGMVTAVSRSGLDSIRSVEIAGQLYIKMKTVEYNR